MSGDSDYALIVELPQHWSDATREAFFARMCGQMPPDVRIMLAYWDIDEQGWSSYREEVIT